MTPGGSGLRRFGDFAMDSAGSLTRNGVPVKLQPQPLTLLRALLDRPGQIVTREELRSLVWGEATYVDFEQGLNFCIRQIRAALGDNASQPRYIETLPKQGYRFVAPVSTEDPVRLAKPGESTGSASVRRPYRSQWVLTACGAALAILGVWFGSRWLTRANHIEDSPPSIAVLPLINKTGDFGLDYLVDGATSELTRRLTYVPGLRVIARTSTMQFKGRETDPRSAAKILGVNTIVSGTIRGSAKDLALEIEVSDGRDGSVIITRTFAPGKMDLLNLESTAAEDIATSLKFRPAGVERRNLRKPLTSNAEALDLFMRADALMIGEDPEACRRARPLLEAAIEKDPTFAMALSATAALHEHLGLYFDDPRQHMPEAKAFAIRALQMDDSLPGPHGILGVIALTYDWDHPEAERQLILASGRMSPTGLVQLACVSHLMGSMGRLNKSQDRIRSALADNPLAIGLVRELGCGAYYARQFDSALSGYHRALEVQPGDVPSIWGLGKTYAQLGKYEEALAALKRAPFPDGAAPPIILGEIGYVYGRMRNKTAAQKTLAQLREMSSKMFVDPYFRAVIHLGLGETDATLDALDEAYKTHSTILVSVQSDPKWELMQHNPRFRQLLRRIGFKDS